MIGTLTSSQFHVGDLFTMPGRYERRTFWQWLTRREKRLRVFRVTASNVSYAQYEPAGIPGVLEEAGEC